LGIDESFCPVRAMLGAFLNEAHFPKPDLLTCSVGATCDDFSAIAQRLNGLGFPILWWEIPHRRPPEKNEPVIEMASGRQLPQAQVQFVSREFQRIRRALSELAGQEITNNDLKKGIQHSNRMRALLAELRQLTFTASKCPLPALELLIAEMMAIHYCSDANEVILVMEELLNTVKQRTSQGLGFLAPDAARLYWVNPVADLRVMNLVERCGGRICGTDNMFTHALDPIPSHLPPLEALACMALSDPMVGSSQERAERICQEMQQWNCEGLVVSRIPGASHCAWESGIIARQVDEKLGLPVLEVEIPPLSDAMSASMQSRLEALVETIQAGRKL
jgi:benzoyl-CoA reductase/2-hydroxyglutaryl-CoA dehydratase subunit BcrC/BadD/HgdB